MDLFLFFVVLFPSYYYYYYLEVVAVYRRQPECRISEILAAFNTIQSNLLDPVFFFIRTY